MKKVNEDKLTNSIIVMLFALIACFLWGSAFPCIKIGYKLFHISSTNTYGKILFAGYRFFIASIMIFLTCFIARYSVKVNKINFMRLIILGLIQTFFQYIFFYIGLSNTTSVKGSIISASNTFFTVIIAHFFFAEDKMSVKKTLGVILGFLGVIIVNFKSNGFTGGFKFTGEGFVLISSILGALAGIYTKKLASDIPPFAVSAFQLFTGSIALILVGLLGGGKNTVIFTPKGTILIIYMAFISAAAFSIWSLLLKYNGVGRVSIYKFSIPLFGVALSCIFLNESFPNSNAIIAVILVSIGIYLINKQPKDMNCNK